MLTTAHTDDEPHHHTYGVRSSVGLERLVVAQEVAGSNPVGHPTEILDMPYDVHHDRAHLCSHTGVMGPMREDGSRRCIRCGTTVEQFTEPTRTAGRHREPTRSGSSVGRAAD